MEKKISSFWCVPSSSPHSSPPSLSGLLIISPQNTTASFQIQPIPTGSSSSILFGTVFGLVTQTMKQDIAALRKETETVGSQLAALQEFNESEGEGEV